MGDEAGLESVEASWRDAFPEALVQVKAEPASDRTEGKPGFQVKVSQGGRDAYAVWYGDMPEAWMRELVDNARRILTVPDGPASLGGRRPGDMRWAVDLGDAVHGPDGAYESGRSVSAIDRAKRFVKLENGEKIDESGLFWQNGKLCGKAV